MNRQINCAVALIKINQKYLFSKRHKNPYKNFYEFPGGKIEDNETPSDAIQRECYEELDIRLTSFNYKGRITHNYPEISVIIHIFEIISFTGIIKSKENQDIELFLPELISGPFLDSTHRILKYISLPRYALITPKAYSKNRQHALHSTSNEFILRIRSLGLNEEEYINHVNYYINLYGYRCNNFMIDLKYAKLAFAYDIQGIHYSSNDLKLLETRLDHSRSIIYSTSCHNTEEVMLANKYNFDFIYISPVQKDKFSNKKINWDGFKFLSDKAYMPTFALGGLNINDLDESLKSSGYGISGISNFWN